MFPTSGSSSNIPTPTPGASNPHLEADSSPLQDAALNALTPSSTNGAELAGRISQSTTMKLQPFTGKLEDVGSKSLLSVNKTMKNTFWGLKNNWWKQVYDKRFHQFGFEVFDKGLHGHVVEPGFYSSIKNASEYASQELGKPITIEFYNSIHSIACEHFAQVDRKSINVDKDKINSFRSEGCKCDHVFENDIYGDQNDLKKEGHERSFELLRSIVMVLGSKLETFCKTELDKIPKEIKRQIVNKFTKDDYYSSVGIDVNTILENGHPVIERALESKAQVEKELKEIQESMNLPMPFASLTFLDNFNPIIRINYSYSDPIKIEKILNQLFTSYNQKINSLQSDPNQRNEREKELSLRYIAELYQCLEWLHPFNDGQGRTDLVLLSKLLTENGFNPSILYQPYFSTFEPLEKWISYLKEGIDEWRKEKEGLV